MGGATSCLTIRGTFSQQEADSLQSIGPVVIYIFIHQMMVATIKNNKKKKTENLTKLNYNNYIYARRPLLI